GGHILLDLFNRYGLRLYWPFSDTWVAWNLAEGIDVWVLIILLLGLLMPGLFRLVTEEIGARPERRGPQRGAIIALALFAAYVTGRFVLHERAVQLLSERLYHSEAPLSVEAYPSPVNPFAWRGIVDTENTVDVEDVRLASGGTFNPDRGVTNFKPDPSPMLDSARQTRTFAQFLQFARFPLARVVRLRESYRVELRDLRFSSDFARWGGFMAVVEMDEQMRVQKEFITSSGQLRKEMR
ncbi:MAG TPA: metal-dependent hydrolase, partial [Candidatus Acidoferrales bacterium]|nr:metal-dependent hydrolase [Candidatus Acidoferrales bacterium]